MSTNIVTFNGFTFLYENKIIVDKIHTDEYYEVYLDTIVLESNNSKFKKNDHIEQITISSKIYFEYKDGRVY